MSFLKTSQKTEFFVETLKLIELFIIDRFITIFNNLQKKSFPDCHEIKYTCKNDINNKTELCYLI